MARTGREGRGEGHGRMAAQDGKHDDHHDGDRARGGMYQRLAN
jgi:hypothetical protein